MADLMLGNASVQARLEGVGALSTASSALELGIVGPAARACEVAPRRAARSSLRRLPVRAHPGRDGVGGRRAGALSGAAAGDPALARVRDRTARRACRRGACRVECGALRPGELVVAMTEGWRGEIVHVVVTDDRGRRPPAQGGGPVVPQLERRWRPRCPGTRSPTFRSATRASTSPTRGTISDARDSSARGCQQGTRTSPVPGRRRPSFPSASAGGRRSIRARCDGTCTRLPGGDAVGAPASRRADGERIELDVGACLFAPEEAAACAERRARRSRRTTGWPAGPAPASLQPGRRDRAGARRSTRGCGAVRPVAPAALGGGGELQRVRGGAGRARQRGVRPGAVRHSVRRVAAPRGRYGGHRGGEPEHAARRCTGRGRRRPSRGS